jgi:type II secretory ATPase GspE/PulE/Tfp pilus assembly ATPase PilB-like protein
VRHSCFNASNKAIFEALIVDDEVKIAIQERAPALHLQRILERRGEASLFEKAVREVAAGVISLEEACKFREVSSTVSWSRGGWRFALG